jgi:hypothetical protein
MARKSIALRLVKNISKPNNAARGINRTIKARAALRRKRSLGVKAAAFRGFR